MANVSWVFIAIAFLAAVAGILIVATALRKWVFELTPLEWGYTVLLTFDMGALTVAYIDGNGLILLLSAALIVLAILWLLIRWYWRRSVRRYRGAA